MTDPGSAVRNLRNLANEWDRYGDLPSPEWRDQMRRAVVIEMRVAVHRLAEACGLVEPPKPKRRWRR